MRRSNGMLLLFGLPVLILCGFSLAGGQEEAIERFQHNFTVAPGGRLSVENYKGKIQVEGWDQEEVAVDVYKRFEGSSSARSRWLRETQVDFETSANRVRIKVEYPRHRHGFSSTTGDHHCDAGLFAGAVELSIRTPRRVNLDLDGYKPAITVSSIEGDIRIESYKSPITIQSTTGAIRIHTYKETIKMRDVDIEGALYVEMYGGELDIDARDIGDGATVENYKADAVLRLPENIRGSLEIDSGRRANFESDFPVMVAGKLGPNRIQGTINGGGPTLRFKSYKGSLSLRRK